MFPTIHPYLLISQMQNFRTFLLLFCKQSDVMNIVYIFPSKLCGVKAVQKILLLTNCLESLEGLLTILENDPNLS